MEHSAGGEAATLRSFEQEKTERTEEWLLSFFITLLCCLRLLLFKLFDHGADPNRWRDQVISISSVLISSVQIRDIRGSFAFIVSQRTIPIADAYHSGLRPRGCTARLCPIGPACPDNPWQFALYARLLRDAAVPALPLTALPLTNPFRSFGLPP